MPERVTHGEHGDLVVEVDERLDDDLPGARPPVILRVVVCGVGARLVAHDALPLARRAHDRLDHAGIADGVDRTPVRGAVRSERVPRRREGELLRGEAADAFAIHREPRRARGRDDAKTIGLELDERGRRDRLELRDDVVGTLLEHHAPQRVGVGHRDHVRALRHLHRGSVGVAVDGDDRDAESRGFDRHLLAELARA